MERGIEGGYDGKAAVFKKYFGTSDATTPPEVHYVLCRVISDQRTNAFQRLRLILLFMKEAIHRKYGR